MVKIWDLDIDQRMEVDEYLEYVQANVDVRDVDSLAESAWALRALANNREFVIEAYHAELKSFWNGNRQNENQPQSIPIRSSVDFYLRANIWLPIEKGSRTEEFQKKLYAYDMPHDHNFNFLTVGYFGEGYTTDIYEYDYDRCIGYMGEEVQLNYKGRYQLHPGRMLMYESGRDIHIQYVPETISVSLNLMGRNAVFDLQQQYIFDVENSRLIGGAGDLLSNRLFLVEAAELLANDNTTDILHGIVAGHPCDKTKAKAIQSLDKISLEEGERGRSKSSATVLELVKYPLITGNYARSYSGA